MKATKRILQRPMFNRAAPLPRSARRILHVSDLHGNLLWFKWLVERSREFDLVVAAGDHLDLRGNDESKQIAVVAEFLRKIGVRLALCSGNHDFTDDDDPGSPPQWMTALSSGSRWTDGEVFPFCGRIIRCIGWNEPIPAATDPDEFWVMHAPPSGCSTAISLGGACFGDAELGSLCRSGYGPRILFSGHVHEPRAFFCTVGHTLSLNPGFSECACVPNHIVVDFQEGVARHHSFDRRGRERISTVPLEGKPASPNGCT